MNTLAYSFSDLFKSKFVENWEASAFSITDMILSFLFSLVVGLAVYAVYKISYKGVVYSHSFNVSLVLMCVITTAIIITISSNIALSLGMVGALSIVRFRSAIKDPVDIIFLFWALTEGIIVGAQNYLFAIISTLIIGAICIVFFKLRTKKTIYLLVVVYESGLTQYVMQELRGLDPKIKSKNVSRNRTELTVEISVKGKTTSFVDKVSLINGVYSASLVSYNGDYVE